MKPGRLGSLAAAAVLLLALVLQLPSASASPNAEYGIAELTPEMEALLQQAAAQGWVAGRPTFEPTEQQSAAERRLQSMGSSNEPATDGWAPATMDELVLPKGYPLETYHVVTPDGFSLALYRIPAGALRHKERGRPKPVVYLQHGVTLSSACFVVLNANESMAFTLADAGFDVWMGNTRGNTYSRGHVYLKEWMAPYWYTSMDQLALMDLPTMIDFVLEKTGAKKLAYIGHSQGCTLIDMLLASKDSYNDKFSVVVAMGPVVYIKELKAQFLGRMPKIRMDQILKNAAWGEFIPTRLMANLGMPPCRLWPLHPSCVQAMVFFFYGPSQYMSSDDFWLLTTTWPAGVASRNLEHWAQMDRSNVTGLQMYDYGTDCTSTKRAYFESCNQEKYNATTPPTYDLSKIRAPQFWMLGDLDLMSTAGDLALEVKAIPKAAQAGMSVVKGYGHMDFVWDRSARHVPKMAEVMYRYAPGTY